MVDESDDTLKQSVGKGAVIGLVLGAIAVAVVAVGVGLYKKRQSRRGPFSPLVPSFESPLVS